MWLNQPKQRKLEQQPVPEASPSLSLRSSLNLPSFLPVSLFVFLTLSSHCSNLFIWYLYFVLLPITHPLFFLLISLSFFPHFKISLFSISGSLVMTLHSICWSLTNSLLKSKFSGFTSTVLCLSFFSPSASVFYSFSSSFSLHSSSFLLYSVYLHLSFFLSCISPSILSLSLLEGCAFLPRASPKLQSSWLCYSTHWLPHVNNVQPHRLALWTWKQTQTEETLGRGVEGWGCGGRKNVRQIKKS